MDFDARHAIDHPRDMSDGEIIGDYIAIRSTLVDKGRAGQEREVRVIDLAHKVSRIDHRIIRRGRMFGPKSVRNGADPTADADRPRGIYFICLNADIASQFELIQHSWLNNTHFSGLYDERDPLVDGGVLTIQQRPSNLRLDSLSQFVRVRGGVYFFMPGIAALGEMTK